MIILYYIMYYFIVNTNMKKNIIIIHYYNNIFLKLFLKIIYKKNIFKKLIIYKNCNYIYIYKKNIYKRQIYNIYLQINIKKINFFFQIIKFINNYYYINTLIYQLI